MDDNHYYKFFPSTQPASHPLIQHPTSQQYIHLSTHLSTHQSSQPASQPASHTSVHPAWHSPSHPSNSAFVHSTFQTFIHSRIYSFLLQKFIWLASLAQFQSVSPPFCMNWSNYSLTSGGFFLFSFDCTNFGNKHS